MCKKFLYSSLFTILVLLTNTKAARILGILPAPSYSHHQVFIPIFKELAKRGHDLVLLTTHPINDPTLPNIKELSWDNFTTLTNNPKIKDVYLNTKFCGIPQLIGFATLLQEVNRLQIKDERVQALIANQTEHFDLIMMEILNPIMYAFKHRFKAPLIGMISMDLGSFHHSFVGNEANLVLYPDRYLAFLRETMPFWCRLISVVFHKFVALIPGHVFAEANANIKKYFGDNYPPVQHVERTVDLYLRSANPAFFNPRPVTPSTINLYGLHMKKTKPLPKDLQTYFDNSKAGVIYFSLGTNMSDKFMSPELLALIKKVFSELPYDILWKYQNDVMEGKPENVLLKKWIPQQDVLAHPNLKLFINQCGLQSLEEGLYNYVPMLGLPVMCDQWTNCVYLDKRGFGKSLDYRYLKYEEFKNAILSIIHNSTSHKANLKKWSDIVLDTPETSLERAVFWTEYVIRHNGSQHLKGTIDIPLYQYYYLDVILFLTVTFAALIFLFYKTLAFLVRLCFKRKANKSKTN